MGKKRMNGYNDFLDGEKLTDNTEIRTSLQATPSIQRTISPPLPQHSTQNDTTTQSNRTTTSTKRPPLTHFLCLPLVTQSSLPHLCTNLSDLRSHLEEHTTIPVEAIRPPSTLHLTLGVMSLSEPTYLSTAITHLSKIDLSSLLRDIAQSQLAESAAEKGLICENLNAAGLESELPSSDHISVDLRGLVAMHDPSKTSILYAKPEDESGRIYPFAQNLKSSFEDAGLMVREDRDLKLHATILNMIYAKDKSTRRKGDGHGSRARSDSKFDARELIERYEGFVWAEGVKIDRVQICEMGARKVWSGGKEGVGEVVDERYEVVFEKMIGG